MCKRAPGLVYESMECLGGNGYTEEWSMARLYRQAPLNSIWEGSGNVICLDVLRALAHEHPDTVTVFFDEVGKAKGADPRLDASLKVGKLRVLCSVLIPVVTVSLRDSRLVLPPMPLGTSNRDGVAQDNWSICVFDFNIGVTACVTLKVPAGARM